MDWDYYFSAMATDTGYKSDILKELQDNTQTMLDETYISGYDVKIGMDFFKEKATLNGILEFDCLVDRDKVKEKILNSISRKIRYSPDVKIKAGDIIQHQFKYSDEELRTYIVIAKPDPKRGYMESYMTECCFSFNMRDDIGNIVTIPVYWDDNKIMMRDSSIGSITNLDVSSTWGTLQDNSLTRKLGSTITRILVDGNIYEIVGVSRLQTVKGTIKISVKNGVPHEKDDLINGIAYNEYIIETSQPSTDTISGDDTMWMDIETTYTIENPTNDIVVWGTNNSMVKVVTFNKTSCQLLCDYDNSMNYKDIVLTATKNGVNYTKIIKVIGG